LTNLRPGEVGSGRILSKGNIGGYLKRELVGAGDDATSRYNLFMPAGPAPMGFAYFLAAKMAGYTAFCHWFVNRKVIAKRNAQEQLAIASANDSGLGTLENLGKRREVPESVKAGVVRTLIGLAVGIVVGLGFWTIPYFSTHDSVGNILFFAQLVPVRVGEWWLLFRWLYGMRPFNDSLGLSLITWGVLVSFALDAIGVVSAFVLPGGMWVC
jgi:hypothetical protein